MIYGSISLSLMKSLELHIKLDHAIAVWHWLVSMFEPNKKYFAHRKWWKLVNLNSQWITMFRHPSLCFLTWNLAYSLDTLTSKKAWQEALWKYPYQTPVPSWPLWASPPWDHPTSVWVHKGKGREDNLSPPNIVSDSMISPPFQEVLARSVRALMPLAAMMRSFFCICEELDPVFASWKISDLIMNHRGYDIYKGFLKVFEMWTKWW